MTPLTPEALAELAALAEAATPGPWEVDSDDMPGWVRCPAVKTESGMSTTYVAGLSCCTPADARHVAAANPAAVLALVAEVRRLQVATDADFGSALREWLRRALADSEQQRAELRTQRDKAEAEVRRLTAVEAAARSVVATAYDYSGPDPSVVREELDALEAALAVPLDPNDPEQRARDGGL